jgi:hypothetical protein
MNWEKRAREIVLAGGSLAAASLGCIGSSGGDIACGNANPDPCICGRPGASAQLAAECVQEQACEADGGTYNPTADVDGATVGVCTFGVFLLGDAAVDATTDADSGGIAADDAGDGSSADANPDADGGSATDGGDAQSADGGVGDAAGDGAGD